MGGRSANGLLLAAIWAAGCGVTLDLDPKSPDPTAAGLDGSPGDGGVRPRDAGPDQDGGGAPDDGGVVVIDAAVLDAGGDGGATSCLEMPCTFVPTQCGCPDSHTCFADMTGPACRPVGPNARDTECTDEGQCAAGLSCVVTPVFADDRGVCVPYCTDTADCGGGGSICELVGTTAADRWWGFCTTDCDPVAGTRCPGSLHCDYDPVLGGTFCRNPSGAGVASPCVGLDPLECVSGAVCMPDATGGASHCRKLCWTATDCGSAFSCDPIGTVGAVAIGFCRPLG